MHGCCCMFSHYNSAFRHPNVFRQPVLQLHDMIRSTVRSGVSMIQIPCLYFHLQSVGDKYSSSIVAIQYMHDMNETLYLQQFVVSLNSDDKVKICSANRSSVHDVTYTDYPAMYNSEPWTFTNKLENTVNTFQRSHLRKILGIGLHWPKKITNIKTVEWSTTRCKEVASEH